MSIKGNKSIILSYDSQKDGSQPYDFIQTFPEYITVDSNQSIALHSLDLERELIVLDEEVNTTVPLDNTGNTAVLTGPGFLLDFINSDYSYTEPDVYTNKIRNILVQLDKGSYTKSEFLQELKNKTQEQIDIFNASTNIDFQYQARVVDNGDESYFGISSIYRLAPVRLSTRRTTAGGYPITSSNNIETRNVDANTNIYATYRSPNFRPSSAATAANTDYSTFAFGSIGINTFNNHGSTSRNEAEVENSTMTFCPNLPNTENGEFVFGFLSETYAQQHWTSNAPKRMYLRNGNLAANTIVPQMYLGVHFDINNSVETNTAPYTVVTVFASQELNHKYTTIDANNILQKVYRKSTDPCGNMIVTSGNPEECGVILFKTIVYNNQGATGTTVTKGNQSVVYQNQYFFNVYYRYTTDAFDVDNSRMYFQFGTTSADIAGKSTQLVLFDSKDIGLQISKELCKETFKLYEIDNPEVEKTTDPNTGLPGGLVPFFCCRNVTNNTNWDTSATGKVGWTVNANLNRTGVNNNFYNIPFGLYSYRIDNITPQLQRILGAKEFRAFIPNRRTDLDAELGIVKFFQENKKYNIILKTLPLNTNVSSQKGDIGKKQSVIFHLNNAFDNEITEAGNRSIIASLYAPNLKFISLDSTEKISFNTVGIEIRDAITNKIAKEVLDFSCELIIQ